MISKKADVKLREENAACIAGLLETTVASIKDIFVQLGISNTPALRGTFVRLYGNTFSAYRRVHHAKLKAAEASDTVDAEALTPGPALLDPAKRRHGRPAPPRDPIDSLRYRSNNTPAIVEFIKRLDVSGLSLEMVQLVVCRLINTGMNEAGVVRDLNVSPIHSFIDRFLDLFQVSSLNAFRTKYPMHETGLLNQLPGAVVSKKTCELIDNVTRDLRYNDDTVASILSHHGVINQVSFDVVFKRLFGCSVVNYRVDERDRLDFKPTAPNRDEEDSEEITPIDQKENDMDKDQNASKNRVLKAIAEGLLDLAQLEELITPKDSLAAELPPEPFSSDVLWFVLHRVVHSPKDLVEVLDNLSIQNPNAFNRAFEARFQLSMEEYRSRYWFQSDHPMALRDYNGVAALKFKTNSMLEAISDALMNTPWSTEVVLKRFGVDNDPFTQNMFREVFGCDVNDYPLPSGYGHGESARSEVEEDPIAAEVEVTLCQGPPAGVVAGGERARWFPVVVNGVFEHTVRIVAKAGVLPPYAQKDLLMKYFDQIDQFVQLALRPLFKGELNVAYLQTLRGPNAPPYMAQGYTAPKGYPVPQGTPPTSPLASPPFQYPSRWAAAAISGLRSLPGTTYGPPTATTYGWPTPPTYGNPPFPPEPAQDTDSFGYPSAWTEAPASGHGSFPQTEYPPQFGAVYRDPRNNPGHPQYGDWMKRRS